MIKELLNSISSISGVQCWAQNVDVSRGWLYKTMREVYGLSPLEILQEVRYEKIVLLLENDLTVTGYCIAKETGFSSEDSFRMFLRRNYDTNLKTLREEILSGQHSMDTKLQYEW